MERTAEKKQLRDLQLAELQILQDFKELCRTHELTFFITAGTLLGAVRHGGFIPWDDDIDVIMPRADFDRLAMICREKTPAGYFYQDRVSDPYYPYFFSKLRHAGTIVEEPALLHVPMHKGIYIDIFPLDICPDGELGGRVYFKWVEQLQCAIMAQVNPDFVCGYKKWHMRLLHYLLSKVPLNCVDGIWNFTRSVLRIFCSAGRWSTACASHGYPFEVYDPMWFSSSKEFAFEGVSVPAPCGWQALLHNMYGDYMTLPPEQERQGHFI